MKKLTITARSDVGATSWDDFVHEVVALAEEKNLSLDFERTLVTKTTTLRRQS